MPARSAASPTVVSPGRSAGPSEIAAEVASEVEVTELAGRLRLATTRLARRLRQEADAGLTPSQLSALAVIDHRGPLTLGSLAEIEQVAPPSVTKVVAKLEAEGLVERTADPTDRRFVLVAITDAGRALMDRSRQRRTAWLAGRLHRLDPVRQADLLAALDVLEELSLADPR
jgi:DNA-binding MarR family transcriptional regulator